mmetsp:Transcript_36270/g.93521  ORF Transcript_36270/g.93521 Transcript_36270/m.93521 type:complete len:253 (+) Transcript_36270:680-1438(+)
MALQAVRPGERLQGAVRQLVAQLVPPRAVARELGFKGSEALRQRPAGGEQLQQVPQVVRAGERDPPGRAAVLADEARVRDALAEPRRVDALRRVPGEVEAGRPEEGQRALGVQVHLGVEAQVEAPDASQAAVGAGDCGADLDRVQLVHVLAHRLVSHRAGAGARLLEQEARELDVQGEDGGAVVDHRGGHEGFELLVEVRLPDLVHLLGVEVRQRARRLRRRGRCRVLRSHGVSYPDRRRRMPPGRPVAGIT